MTGIFGPQNANAALTLPNGSDKQRYGAQQTWVKDCSGPGRNDGTVLDGAFYNRIIGNLDYLVSQAGVTAVPGDFTVIYRAVLGAVAVGAPAALNSIKELADALGDNPNYAATVLQSLSLRVRVDAAQYFTAPQKAQAVVNLGLSAVSVSGAYADLAGLPTLGTAAALNYGTSAGNLVRLDATTAKLPMVDGSLLTNVTVTWANVSGKPTFATVATSGAYTDLTGLPTLGTAASKNVGTAAGNVVQLDVTTGKLPAVDGSLLINVVAAVTGSVVYNTTQTLTAPQQAQARSNISAAKTPASVTTQTLINATGTYTTPAGCVLLRITLRGGGGGGYPTPGGGGGGGGGQGARIVHYIANPVATYPYAVGAGGAAGSSGGATTWNSAFTAGGGGPGGSTSTGGAGGIIAGSTPNVLGVNGAPGGSPSYAGSPFYGGPGGGEGGGLGATTGGNATAGQANSGGGGGGCASATGTGAAGGSGVIVVEEFY